MEEEYYYSDQEKQDIKSPVLRMIIDAQHKACKSFEKERYEDRRLNPNLPIVRELPQKYNPVKLLAERHAIFRSMQSQYDENISSTLVLKQPVSKEIPSENKPQEITEEKKPSYGWKIREKPAHAVEVALVSNDKEQKRQEFIALMKSAIVRKKRDYVPNTGR